MYTGENIPNYSSSLHIVRKMKSICSSKTINEHIDIDFAVRTLDTNVLSSAAVVMNARNEVIAALKSVYFFTRGFTQPLN